jgi:hypothetical protein
MHRRARATVYMTATSTALAFHADQLGKATNQTVVSAEWQQRRKHLAGKQTNLCLCSNVECQQTSSGSSSDANR